MLGGGGGKPQVPPNIRVDSTEPQLPPPPLAGALPLQFAAAGRHLERKPQPPWARQRFEPLQLWKIATWAQSFLLLIVEIQSLAGMFQRVGGRGVDAE